MHGKGDDVCNFKTYNTLMKNTQYCEIKFLGTQNIAAKYDRTVLNIA